jgi:putative membrane protein
MMWWSDAAFGPLNWLTMLAMMLLFAIVIVAVVWLIVRLTSPSQGSRTDAAVDILRTRFARGEMNESEFEEAKRVVGRQ